jgi:hypothetical protein
MSSFGVIAESRNVRVVMTDYPVMCANCCEFHKKDEAYCDLFKKALIKYGSHYVRAADCLRSEYK